MENINKKFRDTLIKDGIIFEELSKDSEGIYILKGFYKNVLVYNDEGEGFWITYNNTRFTSGGMPKITLKQFEKIKKFKNKYNQFDITIDSDLVIIGLNDFNF